MHSRLIRLASTGELQLSETAYGAGLAMPEHAHPETCISLLLRGAVAERAGRREVNAVGASIGIKPAGLEHSDRFGPAGSRTLKLRIGSGFVEELEEFAGPLTRWMWVPLGTAAPVMLRMRARLHGPTSNFPGESLEAAWLEELAVELLANLQEDGRLAGHPAAPSWLRDVRREVVGRFREGVRTRALAGRAGVHPVYLARAFRRCYGESISECVRRLRVQEAARLLERSDLSMSAVAYRAGFADQSHFTRTFRGETGLTPGRWPPS